MNFRRIALMVAILAVPCTANAFWFGSNGSCGSCGGCGGCESSCCESSCDCGHSSCGSHGSFGGCFHRLFSHASCGSCGGCFQSCCGCESSCGCQSCGCGHESCGCGHEASSCGCGGDVHEDGDRDEHAPAPMKEERRENRGHKNGKKMEKSA